MKMNFNERAFECTVWIQLAQGTVRRQGAVKMVINFRVR